MFLGSTCFGAEVVMKSGDRFETSQVWEQDDKIRFNMSGLIVDVLKDDVAEILQDQDHAAPGLTSERPPNHKSPVVADPKPQIPVRNFGDTSAAASRHKTSSQYPDPEQTEISLDMINHGTGLPGIYWQMMPEEVSGLEWVETDPAFGGIHQYWRPNAGLQWGRVALDGWVYGFWQNQLYSITMWVNGWSGYEKLRQQSFTLFGPGIQNNQKEERYVWADPANQRMLEYDRQLGVGILIMRSSSVDAQIKKLYPGS